MRRNRNSIKIASIILSAMMILSACGTNGGNEPAGNAAANGEQSVEGADAETVQNVETVQNAEDATDSIPLNVIDDNYRTYYEVFVYSFCDSDGDGIGDLQGLISKLDYINDGDDSTDTDLGCNGIWLMPVNPSPTYHKYCRLLWDR